MDNLVTRDDVLNFIKSNGSYLRHLSEDYRDDKDVVILAVNNFCLSFQYASPRLRRDKDVINAAVVEFERLKQSMMQYSSDNVIDVNDVVYKYVPSDTCINV